MWHIDSSELKTILLEYLYLEALVLINVGLEEDSLILYSPSTKSIHITLPPSLIYV